MFGYISNLGGFRVPIPERIRRQGKKEADLKKVIAWRVTPTQKSKRGSSCGEPPGSQHNCQEIGTQKRIMLNGFLEVLSHINTFTAVFKIDFLPYLS